MRNHTTRPNGATISYGDPRKNCHAAAYPAVIANGDRQRPLASAIALYHIRTMTSRVDTHIRTYESIIAYGDIRLVKHRKSEISEEPATYAYMSTVVTSERLIDVYILIILPKYFGQKRTTADLIAGT